MDLRSAITKEAGKTIQILAQIMGEDFESLSLKFLSKDSLIKLLHSGTKMLAENGHQTILGVLHNVCVPK